MSRSAHYVTQSGFYDALLIGKPLTDRRIAAIQRKNSPPVPKRKPLKRKLPASLNLGDYL